MIKAEEIRNDAFVQEMVKRADLCLNSIGYTEHSFRHTRLVAERAKNILKDLGCPERECELAEIAGELHDIGNAINRLNHPHLGALLAKDILKEMGMPFDEIALVMSAIGNHDENYGGEPVNIISAALIIADKSDVHRTRVRNTSYLQTDIHDRVNYAAVNSNLRVDKEKKIINLELKIDTSISQVMEYFEIFLSRMLVSKKSAKVLSCKFNLIINEHSLS